MGKVLLFISRDAWEDLAKIIPEDTTRSFINSLSNIPHVQERSQTFLCSVLNCYVITMNLDDFSPDEKTTGRQRNVN